MLLLYKFCIEILEADISKLCRICSLFSCFASSYVEEGKA